MTGMLRGALAAAMLLAGCATAGSQESATSGTAGVSTSAPSPPDAAAEPGDGPGVDPGVDPGDGPGDGSGDGGAPDATPEEEAPAPSPTVHATEVPPLSQTADALPEATVELVGDDGDRHLLAVRVAATQEARRVGLMGVEELPPGTGMWFAYDEPRDGGYWMKGTPVPLQIAWVDAAGTIVAVADMVPCAEDPCPVSRPGQEYRSALEVAAGFLDGIGVGVGDRALLRQG